MIESLKRSPARRANPAGRRACIWSLPNTDRPVMQALLACCFAMFAYSAYAQANAAQAFSDHCFSPFLTADLAAKRLSPARYDFYDLRPFSASNPVSEPQGRPVTPGTDRRCEVAYDGDDVAGGIAAVEAGLTREGIKTEATVPAPFPAQPGTAFIAARLLNPNRIAVVQVGTRPGPNGVETFINVERLVPLNGG